jgi:DNA replication protein DnaC
MVKETCETFHDPESGIETTIVKPTVEAYLMDRQGRVETAKALGFDYYELNAQLSSILLQRLTRTYRPLHEVGSDPDYLRAELESLGLMAPQKEAVKAVVKGFRNGARGLAIRGNTGTGKTYMAKSIKLSLPEVRRTVFVTEPHLVPQIAQEYAQEPFAVHRIESWKT